VTSANRERYNSHVFWFRGLLGDGELLGSRGKYFPHGEDRTASPSPPNDQVKFATYTRDSATGLDYADQRYYTASLGRFLTQTPTGRKRPYPTRSPGTDMRMSEAIR